MTSSVLRVGCRNEKAIDIKMLKICRESSEVQRDILQIHGKNSFQQRGDCKHSKVCTTS